MGEPGMKREEELRGAKRGSENNNYREEIERNAITKTDDNKGKRGDPREKTLVPDCRNKERQALTERERRRRAEKPATLPEERGSHRYGIA
ncbi:hypothetical protein NDU88_013330 [Pleurodeles waltl]|uniref:Uncharacterized protein n=1 Tax=Pleurodeles waltl TaxID=8319 RepID=A0AAV7R464_PLEWA|nr:hypothetical protein NDU88_013330 [Pleurodeles waltl]